MSNLDKSFDDDENVNDVNAAIAEYHSGNAIDQINQVVPVKKLSDAFDGCVKTFDTTSSMKVYLRVRPSSKPESTIVVDSATSIVTTAPETSKRAQYTKTEERHYSFTRVFGPNSQQNDIYEEIATPLLDRFVKGDSCVLLAYGMTNAGKTYTIQGTSQNPGLLPKIVDDILLKIALDNNCELQMSMLEVYQEKIFDLTCKVKNKLTVRDGNGRVEISKLSNHAITSSDAAMKLLDIAAVNRSKSQTLLNHGSSRSHAIYTLTLNRKDGSSSAFHITDLAGAERNNRTKATAVQQKEANNINVSLMQLWRCLQGMKRKTSDGNGLDLIPYRESKLTHILMPELGRAGLAGVAMITCVNPQFDDYDETISILGNASLACKIKEIVEVGRPTPAIVPNHRSSSIATTAIPLNKRKRGKNSSDTIEVEPISNEHDNEEIEVDNNEVKRLRVEVAQLKAENQQLLLEQMTRETELREEISQEMAKRSARLLEQIQSLQEQLNKTESNEMVSYITKSCKKAKRKHVEKFHEDNIRDLQDAEEEFERIKTKFEEEISILNDEKYKLEEQVNEWKSRAEIAMQELEKLQVIVARDLSPSKSQQLENPLAKIRAMNTTCEIPTSITTSDQDNVTTGAEIFSQRLHKRESQHKNGKKTSVSPSGVGKAKKRSPLGNRQDNNQLKETSATVHEIILPRKSQSPIKAQSKDIENMNKKDIETSNATSVNINSNSTKASDSSTYFKKLRSHFALRG